MIPKKRLISLAMVTIMVLGTLSTCVPEKTKGNTGTNNTESNPVMGAKVNLEWTNDGYNKENFTFSDITGYYEMNVALGTANITAGHSYIQGTEILYVENHSSTVTINASPDTYWENITLPPIPQKTATIIGCCFLCCFFYISRFIVF